MRAIRYRVVAGALDDFVRNNAGSESGNQALRARSWNDFIAFGRKDHSGRTDMRCIAPGFELVLQQPAYGNIGKLFHRQLLKAVIRRHEDQPRHRPGAREAHRYAASQAPADNDDTRMLGVNLVVQSDRVRVQGFLGWISGTTAVSTIV